MKTKVYDFRMKDGNRPETVLEGYAYNIEIVRLVFPLAYDIEEHPFRVLSGYDFDFDLREVEVRK